MLLPLHGQCASTHEDPALWQISHPGPTPGAPRIQGALQMSRPLHMAFMGVCVCRWGALLCGIAALLAAVFLALLGYYIHDRHASRRARAQVDVEKVSAQRVKP